MNGRVMDWLKYVPQYDLNILYFVFDRAGETGVTGQQELQERIAAEVQRERRESLK